MASFISKFSWSLIKCICGISFSLTHNICTCLLPLDEWACKFSKQHSALFKWNIYGTYSTRYCCNLRSRTAAMYVRSNFCEMCPYVIVSNLYLPLLVIDNYNIEICTTFKLHLNIHISISTFYAVRVLWFQKHTAEV